MECAFFLICWHILWPENKTIIVDPLYIYRSETIFLSIQIKGANKWSLNLTFFLYNSEPTIKKTNSYKALPVP